jgi:galactose mutarotase-like enzyme
VIWPTARGGWRPRALTWLQIYDAWDYPYLCVEPVSNANDGFNRMARRALPWRGRAGPGRSLRADPDRPA